MKKSFLVVGLGRFGSNVAKTLVGLKCDVLGVDINEEAVESISKVIGQKCLVADMSKASTVNELMGKNIADHAVVAIGNNLQASILTVINLKNIGVKQITVRADKEEYKELFKMIGATEVVVPEEDSALSLANQIQSNTILDYYPLTKEFAIVKIVVGANFKPRTLIELNVRNIYDVNIVGILDGDNFVIPKGTDSLNPNAVIAVVGTVSKIRKFDSFLNS